MVAVSAIVVVHRFDAVATRRAIESLLASEGIDIEVVVALNGGDEVLGELQPLARELRFTLVNCGKNRGFASAVNRGLLAATPGGHVFLLNDDAWVEPHAIARCVTALEHASAHCISVAPLVVHADHPDRVDSLAVVLRPNAEAFNAHAGKLAASLPSASAEVLGPCFAAALFRPGAFTADSVGPLDERYFLYYEDVDWAVRARHRGFTSVSAPNALVHHQHALSTRRLGESRRYGIVQRNLLVFATINLSWRAVWQVWVGRWVAHAKGVLKGPYRAARVRALGAAVVRLPMAIASRRRARGPNPAPDSVLFQFSQGMEPGIDASTYSPIPT